MVAPGRNLRGRRTAPADPVCVVLVWVARGCRAAQCPQCGHLYVRWLDYGKQPERDPSAEA
jgi:hypothetical protein